MQFSLARRSVVLLLAAAVPLAAGCDIRVDGSDFSFGRGSARASDQWVRGYDLAAGGELQIININGRISAEAAEGSRVEVVADRTGRGSDDAAAKAALDALEMREEVSNSRVRIEVISPRRLLGGAGHEVRWTVRVPRGVNVQLRTVNGGVQVSGVEGAVVAKSTNGGVRGQALRASALDASTTNGGVEIELLNAPTEGTFSLESTNGGVALAVPPATRATVNARCTNGNVSVTGLDISRDEEAQQSRRRLNGTLNGGGARISLETTNGGVRLSGRT